VKTATTEEGEAPPGREVGTLIEIFAERETFVGTAWPEAPV
jgi:hypothetical protein